MTIVNTASRDLFLTTGIQKLHAQLKALKRTQPGLSAIQQQRKLEYTYTVLLIFTCFADEFSSEEIHQIILNQCFELMNECRIPTQKLKVIKDFWGNPPQNTSKETIKAAGILAEILHLLRIGMTAGTSVQRQFEKISPPSNSGKQKLGLYAFTQKVLAYAQQTNTLQFRETDGLKELVFRTEPSQFTSAEKKLLEFLLLNEKFKEDVRYKGKPYWVNRTAQTDYDSVAAHSVSVLMLHILYAPYCPELAEKKELSWLLYCLLHDIPEVLAGDPPPIGMKGEDQTEQKELRAKKDALEAKALSLLKNMLPRKAKKLLTEAFAYESNDHVKKLLKALDSFEAFLHIYYMTRLILASDHKNFTINYTKERCKNGPALFLQIVDYFWQSTSVHFSG